MASSKKGDVASVEERIVAETAQLLITIREFISDAVVRDPAAMVDGAKVYDAIRGAYEHFGRRHLPVWCDAERFDGKLETGGPVPGWSERELLIYQAQQREDALARISKRKPRVVATMADVELYGFLPDFEDTTNKGKA